MCSSTVCVNDYLSPCQTAVADGTSDNKSACGIYKNTNFIVEPFFGNYRLNHVFDKVIAELFLCYIFIVLS